MYTLEDIEALESAVWDALVTGNAAKDGAMLDDSFLGVYPSGFDDKSGHVAQLDNGPTIREYSLSESRTLELAENVVLFSYRADFSRSRSPATADMESMYVSSIWRLLPNGWRNIFSQDTDCQNS